MKNSSPFDLPMRKVSVVFAVLLTVLFASCDTASKKILQTWKVTKIESTDEDTESLFTNVFLSFYKEGAVSYLQKFESGEYKPLYRMGKWQFQNNLLEMKLSKTTIEAKFKIIELTKEWLVLEIVSGPRKSIGTVLKCQPFDTYRSDQFDALDPSNNTWRQKPIAKENRKQVQQRVVRHIDYLMSYFNMVDKKSAPSFETGVLQTPFGFYSNGIDLKEQFEKENLWVSCFYDEEDAALGGKMVKQGMSSIEVYPGGHQTFTQDYFSVLKSIKEHIEK